MPVGRRRKIPHTGRMVSASYTSDQGIGQPVRRKEDMRFIQGRGRYVDDLGQARDYQAAFLRSPHAHAEIKSIDIAAAARRPGVIAVYLGTDMERDGVGPLPCTWAIAGRDGKAMAEPPHPALCVTRVRHVGDPVAVVIARTSAIAADALDLIEVDYEPLPAVSDTARALDETAPQIWDEAPGNLCCDWEIGDETATAAAFDNAAHVVEIELQNNRLAACPMEPRAARAAYDPGDSRYTLFTTSQIPHGVRAMLCHLILHIPETDLRVVSPDVGGGFGTKIFLYSEETVLTWASAKLDRPVAWRAARAESFLIDAQGRDHVTRAEMAFDTDGRILGLRVSTIANIGAYLSQAGAAIPTTYYAQVLSGVYRIPAIHARVRLAFTNTACVDAYRGAGRPEATYVLERLLDKAACELAIDRLDLRRLNFIPGDAFPYETPLGLTYDSGDHHGTLERALTAIDFNGFAARREASKKKGLVRGIGFSTYLEIAGGVPSRVYQSLGTRGGRHEAADVRVHPSGAVTVFAGTHSQGQGHETAFAQIVADRLGLRVKDVSVVQGDTDRVHFGCGTVASRSLVIGGSAIVRALDKVIDKSTRLAAHALEANAGDIEVEHGTFRVTGTDRKIGFREIAAMAYSAADLPDDDPEPGLVASAFYDPENWTYPGGCHACEIEIDPDTGVIEITRIVAVDDVGNLINPMIVEGQIQGGLAQSVGQALFEHVRYEPASGQLQTGSYMDYAMPRADTMPALEVHHHGTICTHNPLGAKGCAEVGTVGLPPAIVNAALNALSDIGVEHLEMPLTSEQIWRAIRDARIGADPSEECSDV